MFAFSSEGYNNQVLKQTRKKHESRHYVKTVWYGWKRLKESKEMDLELGLFCHSAASKNEPSFMQTHPCLWQMMMIMWYRWKIWKKASKKTWVKVI